MISSSQAIGVLAVTTAISGVSALICWFQDAVNVGHRERVKFVRASIILMWIVPACSMLLLATHANKVVGSLIPGSENWNRALGASKARVLAFESENSHVAQAILGLYLVGVAVMLVRLAIAYLRMRHLLLHSSEAQIRNRTVRLSSHIASPFSFGFLNPQIFVPQSYIAEKTLDAIEVMLAHEETHVTNRDPQWKLLSLLTRAFLFFTPTVLYLHRKLELEMEIECDRMTMQTTRTSVSEYGNILIDSVCSIQNLNPMFAYMSENNLKRRIQAMKTKTLRRPILTTILGSIILMAGVTAVAAVSGVSKFKGQYQIKAEILLNGKVVSSPQFIVLPSEPASMEMNSEHPQAALRMMLTAADFSSVDIADGIDLKMSVDFKSGDHSFRANPRVVVAPGEEAKVVIGADTSDTLEMKIKAERQ